jgi:prevent-host-death family protein
MTQVSISQLKTNPAKVINSSEDAPVEIQKRSRTQAYLVGKDLYESIVSYIEDFIDKKAVEETDFSKGKNFEEVAKDLGI